MPDELASRVPTRAWPPPLFFLPFFIAATCNVAQPLPQRDGAGKLDPPSNYAAYWYEAEQCTGRRSDFRAITWYVVPTEAMPGFGCEASGFCNGQYFPEEAAIYLSDKRVSSRNTVKHEILHALGLFHEDREFWRCLGEPMPERYKDRRRTLR